MRRILGLAAVASALLAGSMSAQAQIEEKKFNVIGTWNFINNWKKIEQPFWSEMIGKNTGGKITANIKSVTEVNLKGTEVLRLLKTGVYDIAPPCRSMSTTAAPSSRRLTYRAWRRASRCRRKSSSYGCPRCRRS